ETRLWPENKRGSRAGKAGRVFPRNASDLLSEPFQNNNMTIHVMRYTVLPDYTPLPSPFIPSLSPRSTPFPRVRETGRNALWVLHEPYNGQAGTGHTSSLLLMSGQWRPAHPAGT